MPAVTNKTHRPLSVPLPGGKTLHLSPGKTGQITARAADDGRVKKLVEAGEIEIVDDQSKQGVGSTGSGKQRSFVGGGKTQGSHRSGDR